MGADQILRGPFHFSGVKVSRFYMRFIQPVFYLVFVFLIVSNICLTPIVADAKQIFSGTNMYPIKSLPKSHPFRRLARPVGRLIIKKASGSTSYCTAFIISPKYIMTNAHCVPGDFNGTGRVGEFLESPHAVRATLEMGYLGRRGERTRKYRVDTRPVETSRLFDFSILRVKGNPSARWGQLELQIAPLNTGGKGTVLHHPAGAYKHFNKPNCKLTRPSPFTQSAFRKFGIGSSIFTRAARFNTNCNIKGGSSGSPFLDIQTKRVVGLISSGSGQTISQAIPISLIAQNSQIVRDIAFFTPKPLFQREITNTRFSVGSSNFIKFPEQISISADGNLITSINGTGILSLYDLKRQRKPRFSKIKGFYWAQLSADGRYVATVKKSNRRSKTGEISLRNVNMVGKKILSSDIRTAWNYELRTPARFHPERSHLTALAKDGYNLRTWDADNGTLLHDINANGAIVWFRYSPSGNKISTLTWEGEWALWDAEDGRLLQKFQKKLPIKKMSTAVQSQDGQILMFNTDKLRLGVAMMENNSVSIKELLPPCIYISKEDKCEINDLFLDEKSFVIWTLIRNIDVHNKGNTTSWPHGRLFLSAVPLKGGRIKTYKLPKNSMSGGFLGGHRRNFLFIKAYQLDYDKGGFFIFDTKRGGVIGFFKDKVALSETRIATISDRIVMANQTGVGGTKNDWWKLKVYSLSDILDYAESNTK